MPFQWSALLHIEPELLAGVLQALDAIDSLRLMVYALEYGDDATASLLRDHSASYPFEKKQLLHLAAAHGCLRVVYALRKSGKAVYSDRSKNPCIDGKLLWTKYTEEEAKASGSRRVLLMHWMNSFRAYCFPEGVMYEAAKLGDLQVVRWLHSTTSYSPFIAVEHAAHAGHLAIAQWLAEHARDTVFVTQQYGHRNGSLQVTAPFDECLGTFAWFARNADKVRVRATHPFRTIHRSGFAFREKSKCVMAVTSSSVEDPGKFRDPVLLAAEEGNIELLEALKRSKDQYDWSFTQRALVQAVKKGQLEALQWLLTNEAIAASEYSVTEVVTTAMDSGQVHILTWLDARFELDPVPFEHVRYAVQGGRLEVVIWAYERFPDLRAEENLLYPSVGPFNPDVAMWLHENKGMCLKPYMFLSFVKQHSVDLLISFCKRVPYEHVMTITLPIFEDACAHSSVEVVRYLTEQHGAWSERGADLALSRGRVDIAKWIYSTKRPCSRISSYAVEQLARQGEWKLLQGFIARDQVADRFRCFWKYPPGEPEKTQRDQYLIPLWGERNAAGDWVKNLVRWTLDNCPDKITFANSLGAWACRHGYSDIVRRLITLEYPKIFAKANLKRIFNNTRDGSLAQVFLEHRPELLNYRVFQWTATHNQLSLLKFLFTTAQHSANTSVNFDKSIQLVVTAASKHGHLGILKCIHLDVKAAFINPWTSARHGQVHLLEWLHESGVMNRSKLEAAIQAGVRTGQLAVLK